MNDFTQEDHVAEDWHSEDRPGPFFITGTVILGCIAAAFTVFGASVAATQTARSLIPGRNR